MSSDRNTPASDVAEFNANWMQWKAMVKSLPDVRADKVEHARAAIHGRLYDADDIVDEAVKRIAEELATG